MLKHQISPQLWGKRSFEATALKAQQNSDKLVLAPKYQVCG